MPADASTIIRKAAAIIPEPSIGEEAGIQSMEPGCLLAVGKRRFTPGRDREPIRPVSRPPRLPGGGRGLCQAGSRGVARKTPGAVSAPGDGRG